jgi:hypothetical protein
MFCECRSFFSSTICFLPLNRAVKESIRDASVRTGNNAGTIISADITSVASVELLEMLACVPAWEGRVFVGEGADDVPVAVLVVCV